MAHNWKSWKVRHPTLILAMFIEGLFIVVVITTVVLTKINDGWIVVKEEPLGTIRDTPISSRVQWTVIPAIFMALFGLLYASIVTSAAQRQPFVDLMAKKRTGKASNAQLTIMLDYLAYPIFYSWVVAMKNGHLHLSGPMFVQLLCSVLVVPLTSNLFYADTTQVRSAITLNVHGVFNASRLDDNTSILSALNLASAISSYGAGPPAWMTLNTAVETFTLTEPMQGHVEVLTVAYNVEPRCVLIPASEVNATTSANSAASSISTSFADRDCQVDDLDPWKLSPTRDVTVYSLSWYQRCSGSLHPEDRIGIFAAVLDGNSEGTLINMTLVSCFPTYRKVQANLTMVFDKMGPVSIVRVDPLNGNGTEMESLSFRHLHADLHLARTQDTSLNMQVDSFGMAVRDYAQRLSPGTHVDQDAMLIATSRLYSTFFASLASNQLMQPPAEPIDLPGTLTREITKLFASEVIACALGGLLFFMLLSTITILIHTRARASCLQEEPVGLLRWLMVSSGSNLVEFVSNFNHDNPNIEQPGEHVKEHYNIYDASCWYEHQEGTNTGRIIVKDLVELPSPRRKWWQLRNSRGPRAASTEHKPLSVDEDGEKEEEKEEEQQEEEQQEEEQQEEEQQEEEQQEEEQQEEEQQEEEEERTTNSSQIEGQGRTSVQGQ